jgi:hypothetical protein
MSAQYRRGSNAIRQQIADDQKGTASYTAQITAEANRADRAEERLNAAREEIAALKAQLQEQQVLLDKVAKLEKDLQNSRDDAHRWVEMYFQKNRAHAKLSIIVRMALTPDEYRDARQDAALIHPKLFEHMEGQ